ncbi:MAG: GGDEF domain-containing protein [Candidatus Devosia phytovorans]|uniref:diguanylate cyclase n=1 Tax=Candidatus Devosia phytovorans TaxID=3121372 RepID=A0AAJ6AYL3_9HYPH|nr:GGDEF domain-containing protein [Devosia sp.]WEK03052.1 MAG: GGDEF domain-containing protein [Devosia sp.]
MTIVVGLNVVIALVLACTAGICAWAGVVLGKRAMGWIALSLLCGSAQTIGLALASGTEFELFATAVLAPVAYLCCAEGIRAVDPKPAGRPPFVTSLVLALALASALAVTAEAPFMVISLLSRLAGSIAAAQAALWMIAQMRRNWIDLTIVGGLIALAGLSAARVPLLLFYHGPTITLLEFRQSGIETLLLGVSGLLVPPLILLLVARTVGDTLADFRVKSERDSLTGLLNRRAFDSAIGGMKDGGSLIFCDIDHFKQVNDRFGHRSGDDVICALANVLVVTGYPAGRLGGEEFVLFAPRYTAEEAVDLAEMIRMQIEEMNLPGLPSSFHISASFGVAEVLPGAEPASQFAPADEALYRAKRAGRNCVAQALPEPLVAA